MYVIRTTHNIIIETIYLKINKLYTATIYQSVTNSLILVILYTLSDVIMGNESHIGNIYFCIKNAKF